MLPRMETRAFVFRLGYHPNGLGLFYITCAATPLAATAPGQREGEGTLLEHRPDVPVCWWAESLLWLSTALPPPQFMDVPAMAAPHHHRTTVILARDL